MPISDEELIKRLPDFAYIHASATKIEQFNQTVQVPIVNFNGYVSPFEKPKGLWFGKGASWLEWCAGNMPEWLKRYKYLYEIRTLSKHLKISTMEEFDKFEDVWMKSVAEEFPTTNYAMLKSMGGYIPWIDLSMTCDSIEIAPYTWEKRLMSGWYYGWDCASGCVWEGDPELKALAIRNDDEEWILRKPLEADLNITEISQTRKVLI